LQNPTAFYNLVYTPAIGAINELLWNPHSACREPSKRVQSEWM